MFLVITILLMAGLAAINFRVSRSVLYPPALLAVTWTILLALLLASGDMYYPISRPTMIVYLAGVVAFSVGAFFSIHFLAKAVGAPPRTSRRPGGLILTGGLILLVAVLPLYWSHIQDLAGASATEDFWRSVRVESIAQNDDWSIKTLITLVWEACSVLAVLIAVTAVAENTGSRFSRIRMILLNHRRSAVRDDGWRKFGRSISGDRAHRHRRHSSRRAKNEDDFGGFDRGIPQFRRSRHCAEQGKY